MGFLIALFLVISCENAYYSDSASSSGKGGSMARFAISGNYLYTINDDFLKTYDITTLTLPTKTDSLYSGWGIETIFPMDDYLFLGSRWGMHIYDIQNPAEPYYVSNYEHLVSCDPVVVSGNYAYVTLNSGSTWCNNEVNELQVINISNVESPYLVRQYSMTNPKGLGVDGNLLFVCDEGLKVFQISNFTDLTEVDFFDIPAYDVIPFNGTLIVSASDGIYNYVYSSGNLSLLSKIPVKKE